MNKILTKDSNISVIKSDKNPENKTNSGIFCSRCYSYIFINAINKKEKIFIKSKCENGHGNINSLQKFILNYKNNYIKDCQICHSHININELYYCYSCNNKNIICIKCRDKYHPKSNKKEEEKNHKTIHFTLRYNCCPLHNKKNIYFCKFCRKYMCDLFNKNEHFRHNILNLNLNKIINLKNKAKSKIEKEEKDNKEEIEKLSNLINKMRNKLKEIFDYKINVIILKRNIINSYKSNKLNYNNIKNLEFIRKNFYNKKNVNSLLYRLNNSLGIKQNQFESNSNQNNIKTNNNNSQNKKI